MGMLIVRAVIAGVIVAVVTELAPRLPRVGALILTLPIVSIVAFIVTWHAHRDVTVIARLARETLVLVPLGLPFFVPLALAPRVGLSFWPAFGLGVVCAGVTIGAWFWLGPRL